MDIAIIKKLPIQFYVSLATPWYTDSYSNPINAAAKNLVRITVGSLIANTIFRWSSSLNCMLKLEWIFFGIISRGRVRSETGG